jgi:FSR family fosmidomycin resistance protein-like MFS transporter
VAFAQLLPLYLNKERGYSLHTSSLALSLYLAGGALGGFLGGHIADKFGGRRVVLASMLGSLPFLLLFFHADGWLALTGLVMTGVVLLTTNPINIVMAQELAPGQSSTVSALMMGFSWGMAGLICVPLAGAMADRYSLDTVLQLFALFPLAGFLLALKLPK